MVWYSQRKTYVELGLVNLGRTLSLQHVTDTLGVGPSQLITRGSRVRRYWDPEAKERIAGDSAGARVNSWFLNSLALTDSGDIDDHLAAMLRLLEKKERRFRKMMRHCAFTSVAISLRYPEPGEISVALEPLLRLFSLATDPWLQIRLRPEQTAPTNSDSNQNLPQQEDPPFRTVYTLTRECGTLRPYEKREYRFETTGSMSVTEFCDDPEGFGGDSCPMEERFRFSFFECLHKQRPIIAPLIRDGYRGLFRIFVDFDFMDDLIHRKELEMMCGVADRVAFVLAPVRPAETS